MIDFSLVNIISDDVLSLSLLNLTLFISLSDVHSYDDIWSDMLISIIYNSLFNYKFYQLISYVQYSDFVSPQFLFFKQNLLAYYSDIIGIIFVRS